MSALFEEIKTAVSNGKVIDRGQPLSLKDYQAHVERLKKLNLKSGDALGLRVSSTREHICWYLSCLELGVVAVPLSPQIPVNECKSLWSALGCKAYFLDDQSEYLSSSVDLEPFPDCFEFIFHSSGSTGIPKAIPVSLKAIRKNAHEVMHVLGTPEASHLGALSYSYTGGLFNSFLLGLFTGGTIHLGPYVTALQFRAFLERIQESKPGYIWLNPVVLEMLVRQPNPKLFSETQALLSCTAPLSHQLAIRAEESLHVKTLQSYGLTETLIVTMERPERNVHTEFSAGVFVSPAEDFDTSSVVLEISNGAVMPGYIRRQEGKLFFEGLSKPGTYTSQDIIEIDAHKRVRIVGRASNVLNLSGLKIGAERIEGLLKDKFQIDCGALSGPDDFGQERLVLVIKNPIPIDQSTISNCLISAFGSFVRPQAILDADELPMNPNGKIDRRKLQNLWQAKAKSS